jgi:hypothetical protein
MADLNVLRAVGIDVDGLSSEQKEALDTLDDSEVQALASITHKLNGGGEVEGFMFSGGMSVVPTQGTPQTLEQRQPLFNRPPMAADGGFVW